MSYDPNPLFEVRKPTKDFSGPAMYKSQSSMSPLMCWYHVEDKKRDQGKYSEIDKAQIEAAIRGVKNKWYKIVQTNSAVILSFLECLSGRKKDYVKAKELWLQLKELEKNKPNATNELLARTQVQPTMAPEPNPSPQGASFDAGGVKANPSPIRGSDGLLEARSACVYLEEIGLANSEREY